MEVVPVKAGAGLERFVAVVAAVDPHRAAGVESYVDWERQAEAAEWLVAAENGVDVGAGHVVVGWHTPPEVVLVDVRVLPEHRRHGFGSELLRHVSDRARAHGGRIVEVEVAEDDEEALGWAERRGFAEVSRESRMVLDLAGVDAPAIDPPEGIEIVTWAERPDVTQGLYEVYVEADPDVPGNDPEGVAPFERWLDADMSGTGDRPEATFVALAGEEVVGYAKLSLDPSDAVVAYHDLTGVKRAWRRRGVAGALKRAQIAWAKEHGYARLSTSNEERNAPIRALNARHGYRLEPGKVILRAPLREPVRL